MRQALRFLESCERMNHEPLAQSFYNRDVVLVARDLLGKQLIRVTREGVTAGRIVETEAYLAQGDSANHASRGRTRRNASMFGPPGRAYVYAIHARFCLNAVTEPEGVASAVLIRALEPSEGADLMRRRRGVEEVHNLCRGPARLCEAFAIDRTLDGWDLTRPEQLWIAEDSPVLDCPIAQTKRIGVTSAHDLVLRFHLEGSRFVSRG
jgi:DNA-3-methyladenine glycosylase